MYKFLKHDLGYNDDLHKDTRINLPISIDELHSPFDREHMWQYQKTRMRKLKKECGCYTVCIQTGRDFPSHKKYTLKNQSYYAPIYHE